MEFKPPISERPTKELLNIISNEEKWVKEIQILAEEELYRRNLTEKTISDENFFPDAQICLHYDHHFIIDGRHCNFIIEMYNVGKLSFVGN